MLGQLVELLEQPLIGQLSHGDVVEQRQLVVHRKDHDLLLVIELHDVERLPQLRQVRERRPGLDVRVRRQTDQGDVDRLPQRLRPLPGCQLLLLEPVTALAPAPQPLARHHPGLVAHPQDGALCGVGSARRRPRHVLLIGGVLLLGLRVRVGFHAAQTRGCARSWTPSPLGRTLIWFVPGL